MKLWGDDTDPRVTPAKWPPAHHGIPTLALLIFRSHFTFAHCSLVFLGECWPLTLWLCPLLALLVWFFASKQKRHCRASRMPLPLLMVLTWHIYIYCSSTYTQSEYWIEKSHLWALWPFVLLQSGPIPTGSRQKVSQFETWQCIAMLL